MSTTTEPVVILGAGPAGLTAAYELSNHGVASIILEKDTMVGGLSRTVEHNGYLFDIGGHRFYSKVPLVEEIWKDVLGDDLLSQSRLSRIYYNSKFFRYPLDPLDVLRGLGSIEVARCGLSFAKARLIPHGSALSFKDWVTNHFGERLFELFFKAYTEKVWGVPCDEIHADWAAQRIPGLSLASLAMSAIHTRLGGGNGHQIKTLITTFQYPRRGPGMMWSRMRAMLEQRGCQVILSAPVERVFRGSGGVTSVLAGNREYPGRHFISSIPIGELLGRLDPQPPETVRQAALDFRHRDFLTVALILRGRDLFPDHWIYVHDPRVAVGRIQNYNNWSPEMSPNPANTCLGLEYFCREGDGLWNLSDEQLIRQARRELDQLGLARPSTFVDGHVVRAPKAYPFYDKSYRHTLATARGFLETIPNLQPVGRNGMHRYNNQDHSMLTGISAARNILGARLSLWDLEVERGCCEERTSAFSDDEGSNAGLP